MDSQKSFKLFRVHRPIHSLPYARVKCQKSSRLIIKAAHHTQIPFRSFLTVCRNIRKQNLSLLITLLNQLSTVINNDSSENQPKPKFKFLRSMVRIQQYSINIQFARPNVGSQLASFNHCIDHATKLTHFSETVFSPQYATPHIGNSITFKLANKINRSLYLKKFQLKGISAGLDVITYMEEVLTRKIHLEELTLRVVQLGIAFSLKPIQVAKYTLGNLKNLKKLDLGVSPIPRIAFEEILDEVTHLKNLGIRINGAGKPTRGLFDVLSKQLQSKFSLKELNIGLVKGAISQSEAPRLGKAVLQQSELRKLTIETQENIQFEHILHVLGDLQFLIGLTIRFKDDINLSQSQVASIEDLRHAFRLQQLTLDARLGFWNRSVDSSYFEAVARVVRKLPDLIDFEIKYLIDEYTSSRGIDALCEGLIDHSSKLKRLVCYFLEIDSQLIREKFEDTLAKLVDLEELEVCFSNNFKWLYKMNKLKKLQFEYDVQRIKNAIEIAPVIVEHLVPNKTLEKATFLGNFTCAVNIDALSRGREICMIQNN